MSTYFPFLRGKLNELLALRELAGRIAASSSVTPIIEPVNSNSSTRISLDHFVAADMPFVFITNPQNGKLKGDEQTLHRDLCVNGPLAEYENYIPAMFIYRDTNIREINAFMARYTTPFRAVVYEGQPESDDVQNWCSTEGSIYHHIILAGKVNANFTRAIPASRRIMIGDNFRRAERNADYENIERFTDMNTITGNPDNINWGDYSIVGDQFSETGGPAYAIAIHHVHFGEDGESLDISHYISDRVETTGDDAGKTMEAARKLVADLPRLAPNDTNACDQYRAMVATGEYHGLGSLKKISIIHHLETLLGT